MTFGSFQAFRGLGGSNANEDAEGLFLHGE